MGNLAERKRVLKPPPAGRGSAISELRCVLNFQESKRKYSVRVLTVASPHPRHKGVLVGCRFRREKK